MICGGVLEHWRATANMGCFFPETFQQQTYTISLYENRQHNDQGTLHKYAVYIQKKEKNTVARNLGDAWLVSEFWLCIVYKTKSPQAGIFLWLLGFRGE